MRVLQVISGTMFGGGQRVVLDMLSAFTQHNDPQVRLCALGDSQPSPLHAARDYLVAYNGRYNRLGVLRKTSSLLRRVIQEHQSDIIHTHGWDADLIGAWAARGTRARQVSHQHVQQEWVHSPRWQHKIRRWLTRRYLSPARVHSIAVSDAVRQHWCGAFGWDVSSMSLIRNGVDTNHYQATELNAAHSCGRLPDDGVLTLGVAARLEPVKGIDYLLDAVADLRKRTVAVCLKIAGRGSLEAKLADRCRELGIAASVEFLGQLDDLRPFYNSLDLFVLPSLSEGLPLALLEAMACGKPAVATNVSGTCEVIRDGVDGLLVPAQDAAALSRAIQRLAENPALRGEMAHHCRERVECEFSLARVAHDVAAVYRKTCRPAQPPAAREQRVLVDHV